MPPQKTSKAENLTVRLNPIHPEQAKVLEIIKRERDRGFALVDIITSAILRADGSDPITFQHEQNLQDARLAGLIAQAVKEALKDVKIQPEVFTKNEDEEGGLTEYAKTFGNGFLARVKRTKGEDES